LQHGLTEPPGKEKTSFQTESGTTWGPRTEKGGGGRGRSGKKMLSTTACGARKDHVSQARQAEKETLTVSLRGGGTHSRRKGTGIRDSA